MINFELIVMQKKRVVWWINTRLSNIVNACYNLVDAIPQDKIVKKVLRSLTKDFQTKVTIIEDQEDLDTLKLQE